jgi:hypothetical protein
MGNTVAYELDSFLSINCIFNIEVLDRFFQFIGPCGCTLQNLA